MEFTIGADPELFLQKDGQFVTAHDMVPGTKEEPYRVKRGAVQVDGMALEFNIDPTTSLQGFKLNINTVLQELRNMVSPEYEFALCASADFEAEYMKGLPKEALELGCDPDFNAYTGEVNPIPDASRLMRTAAGHIHVGWTTDQDVTDHGHISICREMAREMDAHAGLYSVVYDRDKRRREMYGKAGAFRPKSYGMEYRVLSNFWLADEGHMNNVHHLICNAAQRVERGDSIIKEIEERIGDEVVNVINDDNQNIAQLVCGEYYGM